MIWFKSLDVHEVFESVSNSDSIAAAALLLQQPAIRINFGLSAFYKADLSTVHQEMIFPRGLTYL